MVVVTVVVIGEEETVVGIVTVEVEVVIEALLVVEVVAIEVVVGAALVVVVAVVVTGEEGKEVIGVVVDVGVVVVLPATLGPVFIVCFFIKRKYSRKLQNDWFSNICFFQVSNFLI